MKLLLIYLPVWHLGYEEVFNSAINQVDTVAIIDPNWARTLDPSLDYLRKEIRALTTKSAERLIHKLYPQLTTVIVDQNSIIKLVDQKPSQIITPDEDISRVIISQFFPRSDIESRPIFLRWDREKATAKKTVNSSSTTTISELTHHFLTQAFTEAHNSSDWWRHVGAVLVKDNQVLFSAANRHQPSDHSPYICGDVRQLFHQGEYMNYSTAEHAEAAVIAEAAQRGISTKGAQLFVTTFPCPYCARLIAHAGISQLFFVEGYATLDGEDVMKQTGVEIIKVDLDKTTISDRSKTKPYQS